jgi:hypothetical protein
MTAFVRLIIEYLGHVRPLGALSPPCHIMSGRTTVRLPQLAIVTLKDPSQSPRDYLTIRECASRLKPQEFQSITQLDRKWS